MRLAGLGALLSTDQIAQYAMGAGFPPATAQWMAAIALRESGGNPYAHNPGTAAVPEDSYGLWQINVRANPGVLSALGLTDPTQLYDPATNARAAAWLWAGNDNNILIAWRATSGPPTQDLMPAIDPLGDPTVPVDASVSATDPAMIALAAGGALLLAWWLR
jgi:hypothetical protein